MEFFYILSGVIQFDKQKTFSLPHFLCPVELQSFVLVSFLRRLLTISSIATLPAKGILYFYIKTVNLNLRNPLTFSCLLSINIRVDFSIFYLGKVIAFKLKVVLVNTLRQENCWNYLFIGDSFD